MLHVPALRAGRSYKSLNVHELNDVRTGEPLACVSQVNSGIVARDLRDAEANRNKLAEMSSADLLAICKKAADLFMTGDLPVDPGGSSKWCALARFSLCSPPSSGKALRRG